MGLETIFSLSSSRTMMTNDDSVLAMNDDCRLQSTVQTGDIGMGRIGAARDFPRNLQLYLLFGGIQMTTAEEAK